MSSAPLQKSTPPTTSPAQTPASAGRINGVYDLPTPGRLAGWAIDRAEEAAAVTVEVYREGKLVKRTRADRHRPDLERGGIGTGRYGFSVDLDPPIAPGMAFALSVRAVTGDGVSGPLRATGKAAPSEDPLRALVERIFDQNATLRSEVRDLRRAVEAMEVPKDHGETAAMLERIELVQARLDGAAAATRTPSEPPVGPGLRLAVGIALGLSVLAVILGLWSVFG